MKYSRNAVYTWVVDSVKTEYPSIHAGGKLEPSPAAFPALYLREIGKSRPLQNMTLSYDDTQYRSTFEAQVFSNKKSGAMSEAYNIMKLVEQAFNGIYYIEDMCEPVENANDHSIYRLVARFHRIVCGGDEMPSKP